jgi:hypothetical protein
MAKIKKNTLVGLQKKLKTDTAIGELFGITRQAVYQLRKRYGIPAVAGRNDARNMDILVRYQAGETVKSIARRKKVSIFVVYSVLSRLNKSEAA